MHLAELGILPLDDIVWAGDEEPGADPRAQGISRKLLPDKLVVRLVAVQRIDHPVAIVPRVGPLAVGFETGRFAEPHQIEPMTGPALAVSFAGKHLFNQFGKCLGIGIGNECGDRFRSRRQPVHHEMQPANESAPCSRCGVGQPIGMQFGLDERIDRQARAGRFRALDRSERPVIPGVRRLAKRG